MDKIEIIIMGSRKNHSARFWPVKYFNKGMTSIKALLKYNKAKDTFYLWLPNDKNEYVHDKSPIVNGYVSCGETYKEEDKLKVIEYLKNKNIKKEDTNINCKIIKLLNEGEHIYNIVIEI